MKLYEIGMKLYENYMKIILKNYIRLFVRNYFEKIYL